MTLVFERDVPGPATHAFIVGVSAYPDAKPESGNNPLLRNVPDIPSADASAMRVADWLYEKRDNLASPLASLEVLLGGAAPLPPDQAYAWQSLPPPAAAIDEPTSAKVIQAGKRWMTRLKARQGDVAFFFICGHGATRGNQPVVFLSDLNADEVDPWGAHINLFRIATAFKQQETVSAAFFFADACQEFIPQFELADAGKGVMFLPPSDPFKVGQEKVSLLSATSHGVLAWEGVWAQNPPIKMGRFTQTLIAAFGASVRSKGDRWIVYPNSIFEDITLLYRLRPDWRDLPFEPSQDLMPNRVVPIVEAAEPTVPVLILSDPADAMHQCDLSIFGDVQRTGGTLVNRPAGSSEEWLAWVPASRIQNLLVAQVGAQSYDAIFLPISPIFDQRVRVT